MADKENMTATEQGIDIIELLQTFWKHKVIIITLMILCTLMMIVKTSYFTEDKYTSSGILYVSNRNEAPEESDVILKSDIDTSRTLNTTYIEILKTSYFLEDVSRSVGLGYGWKDILNMVEISSVNDTELLKVTTTATTAEDAYAITMGILEKAPEKLKTVYKKGEVELVDPPRFPLNANDKAVARNALIGAVAGIVLGALFVFIASFFDTKVRRSEDVARRYQVSILGQVSE